jgi:hypothetical protein
MEGRGFTAAAAKAVVIVSLVSGAAHTPGLVVDEAQASCITWQGGQNCDSPAPRPTPHYQVPSGGGTVRLNNGGGGGGGGPTAAICSDQR